MLKKNPKTRCERLVMEKAKGVCRFYNKIQSTYARILEENEEVEEICCNVAFETEELSGYTSDFVCRKKNGEFLVRECVERRKLSWPSVVQLLDASRDYWTRRGVSDWGIVIDREAEEDE